MLLNINRVGYIYLKEKTGEGNYKLKNEKEKDRTMHEIIYFWLFNYQMLSKKDNKKSVINLIRQVNNKNSNNIINLSFLKTKFETFIYLLYLLLNDPSVYIADKLFLKKILNKFI